MKEAHYHYAIHPLGYPTRIELVIAESQPAVLPLNYGHHKETLCGTCNHDDLASWHLLTVLQNKSSSVLFQCSHSESFLMVGVLGNDPSFTG